MKLLYKMYFWIIYVLHYIAYAIELLFESFNTLFKNISDSLLNHLVKIGNKIDGENN